MTAAEDLEPEEAVDEASFLDEDDAPPVRTSFFAHAPPDAGSLLSLRNVLRARSERDACRCEECVARGVSAVAPEADERLDDEPLRATRDDELVGQKVWNMFARASNSRGIECLTSGSIAATKTLARVRAAHGGEHPMVGIKRRQVIEMPETTLKRGELLTRVAHAYRTHKTKHGRAPTDRELLELVGESVGKNVNNVGMARRRAEKNGLLSGDAPVPAKAVASAPSKPKRRAPSPNRTPPPRGFRACVVERSLRRGPDRQARRLPREGRGARHRHHDVRGMT